MKVNEINAQRALLGLTHDALAKKIGVSKSTLRNWIYGYSKIPDKYIPELAMALEMDVEKTKDVFEDEIQDIIERYNTIIAPFSAQ